MGGGSWHIWTNLLSSRLLLGSGSGYEAASRSEACGRCRRRQRSRSIFTPRRRALTMKRVTLLTLAVLILFAAVGCAKPPQDEQNAAQAELDRARQANADTWAPTEAKAAEESMSAAQAEISAQNQKWMKNYDKAKELLAQAKDGAAKAAEAAAANKQQAKTDSEAAIAAADTAIQTAEAALKTAPKTKDSAADLKLMENDLGTLKSTLEAAKTAAGSEDYKKALES